MKIILGSSSKYRKTVLDGKGYQFEVMNPDIDEKAIRSEDYYKLPLLLARAKGDALFPKISEDALVITSDQVVVCKKAEGIDIAKTYYNFIPDDVIDDFIKNGDPYSKAGGFAIQSPILQPYQNRLEGTEDSTMGMPLELLEKLITEVQ